MQTIKAGAMYLNSKNNQQRIRRKKVMFETCLHHHSRSSVVFVCGIFFYTALDIIEMLCFNGLRVIQKNRSFILDLSIAIRSSHYCLH